jgi:spore germination protein YaaH
LIASAKIDLIIFLSDGSLPLVNSKLLVHIQQPQEEMQNDLMGKIKTSRVSLFFCNSEYTKTFINKSGFKDCNLIRDPYTHEAYIRYIDDSNDRHIVWFEDEQSINKKKEYLRSKGIVETGAWAYSYY